MDRVTARRSWRRHWLVGIGLLLGYARLASAEEPLPAGLFTDLPPAVLPALVLAQPPDEGGAKPVTPQTGDTENPFGAILQEPSRVTTTPSLEAPVTSLTLSPSTVGKSPAAIFVIDQEMIRRSGAQTLPDALRMVPGVHVGIGSVGEPNVTIRGLGTGNIFFPYSSRILVLIDGRSIYDPVVGGIIWSANDVVMQDVERIEVIRGPGATIWGANAVNGVINIITKSAADTQGTLLQGVGGTEYKTITAARVGSQVSQNSHMRIFGKFRDFDDGFSTPDRPPASDGFREFRGGFRWDYDDKDGDKLSVQGNLFNAPRGPNSYLPGMPTVLAKQPAFEWFGGSVQSTWTHSFDDDSQFRLMGIYDRLNFANQGIEFGRDTYILDAALNGVWGERHQWLIGGQVRTDADAITTLEYPNVTTPYDPPTKAYTVTSMLVQDEIELVPDSLSFLAGTKLEVNAFTGFEIQPSGRLLHTIDDERVTWAAVSRAIRRPNRISDAAATTITDPSINFNSVVRPSTKLKSDALVAYEVGYRAQPVEWFSWDVATFYNVYDHLPLQTLTVVDFTPPFFYEWTTTNGMSAESTGVELSGTVEMTDTWKVMASYSYLSIWAHINDPAVFPVVFAGNENDLENGTPQHIVYLRNSWSPTKFWDVDLIFRNMSALSARETPGYADIDLRLAWRPRTGLELAVMGMNLLDNSHPEFAIAPGSSTFIPFVRASTEVQRSVFASVTYEY